MVTSPANELEEFHRFIVEKLANGGSGLTPEQVVDEWRVLHPSPEELTEGTATLQRALAEADRGEYVSANRVIAEARQRLKLPKTPAAE